MAGPTIVSVSPLSGATGVPVNTTISVIFDQEVDLYRLKNGGIFLVGPDQSKSIGPGFLHLDPPQTDEDDFLTSPSYGGIAEADITFQRVDGSGNSVGYYDYGDTASAGEIYRTKVILTPKQPLASLTQYTVHVVGDEDTSDDYDFGLSTRSVFDPRKGANLGNGEALFFGGYTGSSRVQFFIEITSTGVSGVAEYEWWSSIDSVHRSGTTSNSYRLLENGLRVRFPNGLNYQTGDTFNVWCDVPIFMDGSSIWTFTTSDQSPTTLPVASTTLTGSSSTSSSSSSLTVSSTVPEDRASSISADLTTVTVTFGADLDSSTVTSSTVTVEGEAADGSVDESVSFTETLTTSLSVSGDTLTITLDADEIFENNIIIVTLDSTIADTDGNTLGSDYTFFFGTEMSPFYAGIRLVRLRLGSLGNSYPDETISLAIWLASKMADAYTPATITYTAVFNEARRQFVICYAAFLLVAGGSSIFGGSVRKRLGDFDVSRSDGGTNANGLDDILKECWERFLAIVQAGGDVEAAEDGRPTVMAPLNVVKGDDDPDTPHYGRLWENPSTPMANSRVLYYGERRWYKTHVRNWRR